MAEVSLVIPTYRLKDVSDTVKAYKGNLRGFGHPIPLVVFDDSNLETHNREYPKFAASVGDDNIFYVGPAEKAEFIDQLVQRVGSGHEPVIRRLFMPSYGGNRNFTVLYTLGGLFISVDDDMRPHGLFHKQKEPLEDMEVLRGDYVPKHDPDQQIVREEKDLLAAYLDVLGKRVSELDPKYLRGHTLADSMTDLLTNKTKGNTFEPNNVVLIRGVLNPEARVMTAQTFRSGSADVDAVDYFNDFLKDPQYVIVNDMSLRYVIRNFRPCVTETNWRVDCGVSGYDNTQGLPPFIPTKLRFEDYIYRIWLQNPYSVSAHVDAIQTHYRNPYMRPGLAHDVWNEEMANFLKVVLRNSVEAITPHAVMFSRDGHVPKAAAKGMVLMAKDFFRKATEKANLPSKYQDEYRAAANGLEEHFSGFDADEFRKSMQQTVSSELDAIINTNDIWPQLVAAATEIKKEGKLPIRRVEVP